MRWNSEPLHRDKVKVIEGITNSLCSTANICDQAGFARFVYAFASFVGQRLSPKLIRVDQVQQSIRMQRLANPAPSLSGSIAANAAANLDESTTLLVRRVQEQGSQLTVQFRRKAQRERSAVLIERLRN